MAEVTSVIAAEESPRSTVVLGVEVLTTAGFPVGMNERNMASDSVDATSKVPTPSKGNDDSDVHLKEDSVSQDKQKTYDEDPNDCKKTQESPPTPSPHEYPSYLHAAVYPTLTPQQNSGYYHGYAPQQTPEPASPATQPVVYDMNSFFQHQPQAGAFHPASAAGSTFLASSMSLSPARVPMPTVGIAMGSIPPASPLFPRVSSGPALDAHRAPNLPYMSPQLPSYPAVGISSQSSDDGTGTWGASERNQNSYPASHLGPMPYGVPAMDRNTSGGRAYSFDGAESLLPPAALDDPSNPLYSSYNNSQTSPGGTLFAQPSWGYGGPPDLYSQAPASPLQPRPAIGMYPGMQGGLGPGGMVGMPRGPMGSYGQFFPASSPGPPIQTTASNKGPDGANLFIFHIPNHFTNLDMYQLFSPYGNLLSVRIMVERDSGRSRGFGFVSYDSPESAALAIKELNGFPIGNKRLKVQHKQIRRQDLNDRDSQDDFGANLDSSYSRDFPSTLPPSGPNASQNLWFEREEPTVDSEVSPDIGDGDGDAPTGDLPVSATTSDEVDEQVSPLANFEELQNALPDITGKGTPTTTE